MSKFLHSIVKLFVNLNLITNFWDFLHYNFLLFLQRNWHYHDGYYMFSGDVDEMAVDEEMPYVNVAKKMLQYAREMEMII